MTTYINIPTLSVPEKPETIKTAQVPSGNSWNQTARNINYFLGTGHQLIPAAMLANSAMLPGSSYRYSFTAAPRSQSLEQMWELTFSASVGAGKITNLSINGQVLQSLVNIPANGKVTVRRILSTSGSGRYEQYDLGFTCSVTVDKVGQLYKLVEVAAYEIPRADLDADSTEDGPVDDRTLRPASLIYASTSLDYRPSIGGVVDALSSSYSAHLGGLFYWGVPYNKDGADHNDSARRTCNSLTGSYIFSVNPKIQLRNMHGLTQSADFSTFALVRSTVNNTVFHLEMECPDNGTSTALTATAGTGWGWIEIPTGSLRFPTDKLQGSSNGLPDSFTETPSMRFRWKLDPLSSGSVLSLAALSVIQTKGAIEVDTFTQGTFINSTEGSYYTDANSIAWANEDVRRFENRADGYGDMLLLECTGTANNCHYSEQLVNWTEEGGAAISDVEEEAPDGEFDACKVAFGSGATDRIYLALPSLPLTSVDYTISCWVKRVGGAAGNIRIGNRRRDGTTYSMHQRAITTDWTQISASCWNGGSGATTPRVVIQNDTDLIARDVLIWGVQVEDGISSVPVQNPMSYIRTDGFVYESDPGDSLTFSSGQYPESFLTRGFTIEHAPYQSSTDMIERANGSSWDGGMICGFANTTSYLRIYHNAVSLRVDVRENGTQRIVSSAVTFAANQKLKITVKPNEGKLILEGFSTGNGIYTGTPFSWTAGGSFTIGKRVSTTSPLPSPGRYGRKIRGF